jgi:biopolymer transport protein ExbD
VNGIDERTVIILADQNIPYATLHQIMIVCSQQHFGRISFAVNKEASKNAY